MSDIHIRRAGRAGRITLNRPKALNALTYEMCLSIEGALDDWRNDRQVELIVIDATGERAFCAGGDIQDMYDTARAGDFEYGRRFWADEYRLNAIIFHYPKPYVALMQGFTMGGGVGISCHGSHRIVDETTLIAMPECGIGLVPDVGGSLLLSQAPGRCGEYLGTTATRMGPGDAIYAGFADYCIPQADWPKLIADLEEAGDHSLIDAAAQPAPDAWLSALQPQIDTHFAGETLADIARSLAGDDSEFARSALKSLGRVSPLSAACTVEMLHRLRGSEDIAKALDLEYRFTYRSAQYGDFPEGIRATLIDKDRSPKWQHESAYSVTLTDVSKMLMPLPKDAPILEIAP